MISKLIKFALSAAFGLALSFTPTFAQDETENTFMDRASIGVKLGLNFPSMAYSNEGIDDYSSSIYANGLFEIFGEYNIISPLSVRPGIKFTTRGQHIDESGFSYEFNSKYIELAVPVAYTFQPIKDISPYLLCGPVLGFVRGGDIRYGEGEEISYETKINENNSSSYAFGLHFGAGLKYPLPVMEKFLAVLGFEIGYHLGLTDTYSDKELDETANALNAYYYSIEGTRKNRGFELGITISIPLVNFKKPKQPEPPPPEPAPEPEPEPEPEQSCYTINEMKALIREEQDIRGKKICAIKQVNFKFGKAELLFEDKLYLDEMVILMKTNELINVRVNGHTDNVGSDEFNMNLSRDRAKSVHDYLKSKGIDPSRLSFAFFGSTRPIASNDTEEGRAINRRVEFEITNQ